MLTEFDPHPSADPARLAVLHGLELLDTPAEEAFDRLTRLVTRFLRVPVSLVSLVDRDRQFFKSAIGLPDPWATRRETPLSHSFCQHVVSRKLPLIIADARTDPVLQDNLAVAELNVIAYAGIPLISSAGFVLGSLCAIDTVPRQWSAEEIHTLTDLANITMSELELRQENAARRKAEESLAEALRLKNEILSIVSHDLRAPLSTVLYTASALEMRSDGFPDFQGRCRLIKKAVGQGIGLLQDLLDAAHLESGRLPFDRAAVDGLTLMNDLHEQMSPIAKSGEVDLVMDEVEPVQLWGDGRRLSQALINLVGNAIKFTPRGGKVELSARQSDQGVRFCVRDTGVGITQDELGRLFEPFWQRSRDGRSGAGLGLSIVQGIARAHGGRVWVDSRPGSGSSFYLWIPLVTESSASEADYLHL